MQEGKAESAVSSLNGGLSFRCVCCYSPHSHGVTGPPKPDPVKRWPPTVRRFYLTELALSVGVYLSRPRSSPTLLMLGRGYLLMLVQSEDSMHLVVRTPTGFHVSPNARSRPVTVDLSPIP